MYEKYSVLKNYKTNILSQSFGDSGGPDNRIGTKQVTLEVKGDYAYGYFKKETGIHRLVRISPFSAKNLRHTSFALVQVLPEILKDEIVIDISPDDLKIDFYKSSGPGGQNVNKRETAVRITHIPTNISVSSQAERSQARNREKAMNILISKIHQIKENNKNKELKNVKISGKVEAEWGNQIRSYVLHPYKLVKDLRTGKETSNVEKVLDGEIDEFIEAELKLK